MALLEDDFSLLLTQIVSAWQAAVPEHTNQSPAPARSCLFSRAQAFHLLAQCLLQQGRDLFWGL